MSDEVQETTEQPTDDPAAQDAEEVSQPEPEPAADSVDQLPDWAQKLVKDLRSENAKHRQAKKQAEKEAEQAAVKAAEKQGEYKELWEKTQAKLAEVEATAQQLEQARMRDQVARELGLPAKIAERLKGETVEELTEDGKALLEAMPKPAPAPQTDGANGLNTKAPTPEKTEREIRELAARLGVMPNHLKDHLERSK